MVINDKSIVPEFTLDKKINQRKFKKRFLFLSGEPKLHRCQIMKFLDDNDILDNTNYSWNPNNKSLPAAYRSDEIMNTPKTLDCEVGKLYVSEMHKIINEYYTSFVNIVAESYFYDGIFDAYLKYDQNNILTSASKKEIENEICKQVINSIEKVVKNK